MSLKVAVFTDVHSNTFALEAVLADIRQEAPDLLVNLGDQIWGQVDPLGAFQLQASLGAVQIRGNNEEKPLMPTGLNRDDGRFVGWLAERVPQQVLEELNSLPTSQLLADGQVLAAHGTPTSPWARLLWSDAQHRPDSEVRSELLGLDDSVRVVIVGHTHRERVTELDGRLLVNSGPVSRQTDRDPRARWTLLERRGGHWTAELRRVEYDWQAAAESVRRNQPVFPAEVEDLLGTF